MEISDDNAICGNNKTATRRGVLFSVPEDIGRCCLDCVCVEAMYSYAIE